MKAMKTMPADQAEETQPIQTEDPEPLRKDATETEAAAHKSLLNCYANKTIATYGKNVFSGESLWFDFCRTFRPQSIKLWTRPIILTWPDFLAKREIHIAEGKRRQRDKAIIEIL